jgi:hypothetical protein
MIRGAPGVAIRLGRSDNAVLVWGGGSSKPSRTPATCLPAGWDATYNYFYTSHNGQQMVETRNGSEDLLKQYVWGLQYVDEVCQVALNDAPADEGEDDCETFFRALQDANFNVMGLVGDDGNMKERYEHGLFLSPPADSFIFKPLNISVLKNFS